MTDHPKSDSPKPKSKRGGYRPGSGRKKGVPHRRTTEIAAKAYEQGITPLEVMIGAMRRAWEGGDYQQAAMHARDAAPYVHPKLSSVEHSGSAKSPVHYVTRIELVAPDIHDADDEAAADYGPN